MNLFLIRTCFRKGAGWNHKTHCNEHQCARRVVLHSQCLPQVWEAQIYKDLLDNAFSETTCSPFIFHVMSFNVIFTCLLHQITLKQLTPLHQNLNSALPRFLLWIFFGLPFFNYLSNKRLSLCRCEVAFNWPDIHRTVAWWNYRNILVTQVFHCMDDQPRKL